MIPDQAKLALLIFLTVACLGTLFTSPSIVMNNSAMKVLTPTPQVFCKSYRDAAAKACPHNTAPSNNQECHSLQASAQNCERVVTQAYRHINLGGCPHPIKALTLCESEWCRGGNPKACRDECHGVRETLTSCVQEQVTFYLQRNGLSG